MGLSIYRVPSRLYWTADRSRLVQHGDPAAAFLAYTAGQEMSLPDARRYRLVVEEPVAVPVEAIDVVEEKLAAEPVNKLGPQAGNKRRVERVVRETK